MSDSRVAADAVQETPQEQNEIVENEVRNAVSHASPESYAPVRSAEEEHRLQVALNPDSTPEELNAVAKGNYKNEVRFALANHQYADESTSELIDQHNPSLIGGAEQERIAADPSSSDKQLSEAAVGVYHADTRKQIVNHPNAGPLTRAELGSQRLGVFHENAQRVAHDPLASDALLANVDDDIIRDCRLDFVCGSAPCNEALFFAQAFVIDVIPFKNRFDVVAAIVKKAISDIVPVEHEELFNVVARHHIDKKKLARVRAGFDFY